MTVPRWPSSGYVTGLTSSSWDYGVRHFTRRTVAPTKRAVDVGLFLNDHVRSADASGEETWGELAIDIATADCENCDLSFGRGVRPQRAVMVATYEMYLDGYPGSGEVWLQRAPVLEVVSVVSRDENGDEAELVGSPAEYAFTPNGDYTPAIIRPLAGASFPSTQSGREDAVVITYRAGYERPQDVPPLVKAGILLFGAELYKQRSMSVQGVHTAQAVLGDMRRFWGGPF